MTNEPDFDEVKRILESLPADPEVIALDPTDAAPFLEQCPDCGQWLDIRDVDELLRHDGPGHEAKPPV